MKEFSLQKLCKEWKCIAPLFFSFLMTVSRAPKNQEWSAPAAVAGSVLLKQRNVHMNATACMMACMVRHSGVQRLTQRLSALKLSVCNTSVLKHLDSYGAKFSEEIKEMKESHMTSVAKPGSSKPISHPDGSFKVVLDNIDVRINTRDMTSDRQNKDIHWVNHIAVKNRVTDGGHLERHSTDLLQLDNAQLLPTQGDHLRLKKDFAHLICRVITEHIPCLQFLHDVCSPHIPHRYSKEMANKSEKVLLGVILKNENKSEEMKEILHEIQGYCPSVNINDDMVIIESVPVVGDQLTVERGVNIIQALQNSYTSEDKLDGLHMEIADWHAGVTFLSVIFKRHYSNTSWADKGTLFADRNLINRRNVSQDVHSNWANCKAFTMLEVKARIIAATMVVLGMDDIDDEPTASKITDALKNTDVKLHKSLYLYKIANIVLSQFVIDNMALERLVDNILSTQEQEDLVNHQQLTQDGRFPCRSAGCDKSFFYDGKRRRDHEQTHDPPPDIPQPPQCSTEVPHSSQETEPKPDDEYNYNCSLLSQCLLFMNFLDSTSEGDGERTIKCCMFLLLNFKEEKSTNTKYALEALYLQLQVNSLLPPEQAHKLIWNRTVNNKGGLGRNVALDLDLEHENNYLKQGIKNLGGNVTPEAVLRISKSQKITKQVLRNLDNDCTVKTKSGRHTSADYSKDLKTIVKALTNEEVFVYRPGRQYACFPNIPRDPLSRLDTSKLFQWINLHKKNIELARKAR